MEIKLDESTLGGKKVMVGTPMYGGQCYHNYVYGLLEFQKLCLEYQIPMVYTVMANSSLIHAARNNVVEEFLKSDCTHLIFLDADMGFKGIELLAMLACNKDIIGGAYPRKVINWDNVRMAILNNPEITINDLQMATGAFPLLLEDPTAEYQSDEIIKVTGTGTGMMIIERSVFSKFREAYPEFTYNPDNDCEYKFDPSADESTWKTAYFSTGITTVENNGITTKVDMGEDYRFCHFCRLLGIEVWYAPFTNTTHMGSYEFKGSIGAMARLVNGINIRG